MNDSKNALMDRHLKRVERWLRRCVAACKCGSWGDALAEAECLEAETKGLREKIWTAAEDEALGAGNHGIVYSACFALKIAVLAVAMVLAAVIPISLDSENGIFELMPRGETAVLLSSEESDIINALRESLSNGNGGRVVISVEASEEAASAQFDRGAAMAAEKTPPAAPRSAAVLSVEQPQAPVEEQVEEEAEIVRRPSVDEVISLIQVGQRALRSSEAGITIVP